MCYLTKWSSRFFTITSEGIYYTANENDYTIEEMIPFSVGFSLLHGESQTGYTYGIVINSSHRVLSVDASNIYNLTYFVYSLRKAIKENDIFTKKRY